LTNKFTAEAQRTAEIRREDLEIRAPPRRGKRIKRLLPQNMPAGELKNLISCFRLEVVLKGHVARKKGEGSLCR
jgi:hypothetical protein